MVCAVSVYDEAFLRYTDQSSRHAARAIASLLREPLAITSVLDIGCARGTWLSEWAALGAVDIQGVDGDYVARDRLAIPVERFRAHDLARPLGLGRRYDLVQSLEVAEHIPAAASDIFVANLCVHASGLVLFSAAPPGQGGEHHVNEQPYDYWRAKFRVHGYHAHDCIRPRVADDPAISYWYRYNAFLYVRADRCASLPVAIAATRIADHAPLPDLAPGLFRLRRQLVRLLPPPLRDGIARLKARVAPSGRW
ncbi:MAG: methyltransferase domain-containing protein [Xanthomonadales bacterium]|nr:hypothetical protein [Xanthomonadales bacterium]MCC6594445.1 methyltransferase domain-containing protein [Xanthomonadales bacterium]MCE7932496.1 methyltransferase domain-containing protein [Xanthomonadales bacterium PRO6]